MEKEGEGSKIRMEEKKRKKRKEGKREKRGGRGRKGGGGEGKEEEELVLSPKKDNFGKTKVEDHFNSYQPTQLPARLTSLYAGSIWTQPWAKQNLA